QGVGQPRQRGCRGGRALRPRPAPILVPFRRSRDRAGTPARHLGGESGDRRASPCRMGGPAPAYRSGPRSRPAGPLPPLTGALVNIAPQITIDREAGHDELWYRDAIIYQLHVKAFADSNGDGVGDFARLTQ